MGKAAAGSGSLFRRCARVLKGEVAHDLLSVHTYGQIEGDGLWQRPASIRVHQRAMACGDAREPEGTVPMRIVERTQGEVRVRSHPFACTVAAAEADDPALLDAFDTSARS